MKVKEYCQVNQSTDRENMLSHSHRDLSSERSQQKMIPEKLLNLEKALAEQKQ